MSRSKPSIKSLRSPRKLKSFLMKVGFKEVKRGSGSGHLKLRKGKMIVEIPIHGGNKDLGTGLVRKILTNAGVSDDELSG